MSCTKHQNFVVVGLRKSSVGSVGLQQLVDVAELSDGCSNLGKNTYGFFAFDLLQARVVSCLVDGHCSHQCLVYYRWSETRYI